VGQRGLVDTLDRPELLKVRLGLGPRRVLEVEQPGVLLLRLLALAETAGDFGEPELSAARVEQRRDHHAGPEP
jgi:hypothetical protein